MITALSVAKDFPILARPIHGKRLVYLDNAASTQTPTPVIERMTRYQAEEHSNVHRGVHTLSQQATDAYEGAREAVRAFINAASAREVVFTRGTTESINMVARGLIQPGDEVLVTELEHHANIVPWQLAGARLVVAPIGDDGELLLDELEKRLHPGLKLVAVAHVSNALGTVLPVARIVELAHARGVPVLVDGAQAMLAGPVDVQALGCDYYAFSGHKMCGPTGIGVLYGKREALERLTPMLGGGSMIMTVDWAKTTYAGVPARLEAGTPPIVGAVGLAAAIAYLRGIGLEKIAAHEQELLAHATRLLSAIPGVRIIGTAREKAAVLSFEVEGVHPHDVGTILDQEGVAIRAGHHCAQPLMRRLGVPATARASFAFYNTREDAEALAAAVTVVKEIFA